MSFCSLNVPLFNCFKQNAQTKCSGWNLRNIAVMQRPINTNKEKKTSRYYMSFENLKRKSWRKFYIHQWWAYDIPHTMIPSWRGSVSHNTAILHGRRMNLPETFVCNPTNQKMYLKILYEKFWRTKNIWLYNDVEFWRLFLKKRRKI